MWRYEHGGNVYAHPDVLDFSASLNPLGIPERACEVLRTSIDAYARYPDPDCRDLVEAIAAFEGVEARWVVPCAGATDAFARICQVIRPSEALVCAPGYLGFEQTLEQVGARIRVHALRADDGFAVDADLAESLGDGTALVYLANPNNPTGRRLAPEVLRACLDRARQRGAFVVLDECFIDLTYEARSNGLLADYPNLVIVKALTKTFALAGLRVGYALCSDPVLARRLWDAGQVWAVSVPAQLAGLVCLRYSEAYLAKSRSLIARERVRLARALDQGGCRVVESQANYLLFRAKANVYDAFLGRGILIRSCDNFRGLGPYWYRIAVRTPEENGRLIEAWGEVAACLPSR